MPCRILLIGGYGLFGSLLSRRLAVHAGMDLVIAGRNAQLGRQFADELNAQTNTTVTFAELDVSSPSLCERLRGISPHLVINTAGSFQGQDCRVAHACAEAGVDYVDLADGREFVAGFAPALNGLALEKGVALVTGASSVPGLSSAAVDSLSQDLAGIESIDIGIAPGNRTRRGLATARAILSYCGAPVRIWRGGEWREQHAWTDTVWQAYPSPVGSRPLSLCDVPDLELFPHRYAPVKSVMFRAGLELRLLHYMMNVLARLRRAGVAGNWARFARGLFGISELFQPFGSDAGAMHVRIEGTDRNGERVVRTWQLVAGDGDGPYVPTLAAAAIARRYLTGNVLPHGAYPCVGVLSLADFASEVQGLGISTEIIER